MLNLRNVFQLVDDGLNDGSSTQQQCVGCGHQTMLHVASELGDQVNAESLPDVQHQFL